ncbi:hypothetical protein GTA08_BOTSDO00394 [Neofusicoccum parvum]|nr:hypothetical protein GTA08_BOTSDO00394 [Neofusicoccum parvum]
MPIENTSNPTISVLGDDPPRTHRINANSFQQNALLTVNGWQYAAFYASKAAAEDSNACHPTIARRNLHGSSSGKVVPWEYLVFDDYEQTFDDGHNTISIGVCTGDGTIHVSYDHHCDPAGSGSDVLYSYSATSHTYTFLGTLLTGEGNSPYINGIDHRSGRLHVSWTYRKFLEYAGVHDPGSTAHKAQAGPNGPENNYDLCYAYSDDGGQRWSDSDGRSIASLAAGGTVRPTTDGITVFAIPTGSGILNQEAQCAAADGEFHVLNRERHGGAETWMLYSRHPADLWKRNPVKGFSPTETGARGSICADRQSNLYVVLPGNTDSSLAVVRASKAEGYLKFETVWRQDGFDGEPLVDQARLDESDVLSIFTRTDKDEEGKRKVVVIDLDLGGL